MCSQTCFDLKPSSGGGLAGAWSVLFSKSLTYVLTAPWPSQLTDWYSWAVLLAFCATAAFWVQRTSCGLKRYSASCIIPLMQASDGCSSQGSSWSPSNRYLNRSKLASTRLCNNHIIIAIKPWTLQIQGRPSSSQQLLQSRPYSPPSAPMLPLPLPVGRCRGSFLHCADSCSGEVCRLGGWLYPWWWVASTSKRSGSP